MRADTLRLDALTTILHRQLSSMGQATERGEIRRIVEESVGFRARQDEDAWWMLVTNASRSLSFKAKVLDCDFRDALSLLQEGAKIIAHRPGAGIWIAVESAGAKTFRVSLAGIDFEDRIVRSSELESLISNRDDQEKIRLVVMEPGLPILWKGGSPEKPQKPLSRLLAILRPEWSDIWILFVFALITGLLALATPMAVETLVNTVAFGRLLQPIVILALLLFAFLSFSAALRALQTFVVEIIQRRLFARVASDLSYRLPRVELSALDGQNGRELVNRFFDVVTVQKISAQLLLDGISLVMGGMIGMAVLAFYHPWLLGFDVVLLAMIAFVIFVLGAGAVKSSIKESKTKYKVAAWLEDLMGAPLAFRHSGGAEFALESADRLTHDYLIARKSHFRILMRQIVFALGMQALASTVLLGLGGWLVVSGQLTLGQLVAAELIVTVIVGSFAKLGKHMEGYYDLLASIDKLGTLFDLPIEPQDGLLVEPSGTGARLLVSDVVTVDDHGKPVISHLTLNVVSREHLVIRGPSGSGKSQLLDLLFGLRSPTSGYLMIDGYDPRDLRPDSLRKLVSLVRNNEVFQGSIAKNVHLERPDISISDVRETLHDVGLINDVLKLPDGVDTELVGDGYPLTPNQVRKLMIARAIAGRPSLLLIDGTLDALPDEEAIAVLNHLV
ncbi:MAG: ABC transporter ATP-binding protein, partial [Planctomycetaceae bacterium]|nr:ABC transporter ATP-binding protein [Planctomycetaceae bacterium]